MARSLRTPAGLRLGRRLSLRRVGLVKASPGSATPRPGVAERPATLVSLGDGLPVSDCTPRLYCLPSLIRRLSPDLKFSLLLRDTDHPCAAGGHCGPGPGVAAVGGAGSAMMTQARRSRSATPGILVSESESDS